MTDASTIIYGRIPPGLLPLLGNEVQCSPLFPGAQTLETWSIGSAKNIIIEALPGTIERRYILALALQTLAVGATLTALAPNAKGGNRIAEELRHFGCEVSEESSKHYRICRTVRPEAMHHIDTALAEGSMQVHPSHGLWTQPGIFSWNRVDPGSALLLNHLPGLAGRGADLGCGLGLLSLAALKFPAVTELLLIDTDRRAVEAAARNIQDPRARFSWADVRTAAVAAASLDFVIMNPPFHDRGVEDKRLGQQFIERAAAWLKPGGSCWLTANRHLPYEAVLNKRFRTVRRVGEADGFKIYAAEK